MSVHVIGWDPDEPERPDAWLVDVICDCGQTMRATVTEPKLELGRCESCGQYGRVLSWKVRSVFMGPMQKVPGGLIA